MNDYGYAQAHEGKAIEEATELLRTRRDGFVKAAMKTIKWHALNTIERNARVLSCIAAADAAMAEVDRTEPKA